MSVFTGGRAEVRESCGKQLKHGCFFGTAINEEMKIERRQMWTTFGVEWLKRFCKVANCKDLISFI